MNETPLFADCANDSYRWTSRLNERELHPCGHPAAAQLLPEVEGGLIDKDDLVLGMLFDNRAQLLHERQLLLLQGVLLSEALPISVIRHDVLHLPLEVVPQQGHRVKGLEIIPVSDNHCPLLEAQVHHALQGVNAGDPLHLLGGEDPLPPLAMDFQNEEAPFLPPGDQLVLSTQFDPRPPEDLGGGEPLSLIRVDAAEPEEYQQGLHLLRQLLPDHEPVVPGLPRLPEGAFLVL